MTRREALLGSLCALQTALLVCGAAWAVGFYGADERESEARLAEARAGATACRIMAGEARFRASNHIHNGAYVRGSWATLDRGVTPEEIRGWEGQ